MTNRHASALQRYALWRRLHPQETVAECIPWLLEQHRDFLNEQGPPVGSTATERERAFDRWLLTKYDAAQKVE